MRRKYCMILAVTLLLVVALLLPACAGPAPTPPTPPTPPAPPPFKGVTLRFAYTMPLKMTVSQGWHWWAEELEKRTEGKVKVEFYPGGTLFALAASVDSVIAGVADIAMTSIGAFSERYPLSNVGSLPTASFPDTAEGLIVGDKALMTLSDIAL